MALQDSLRVAQPAPVDTGAVQPVSGDTAGIVQDVPAQAEVRADTQVVRRAPREPREEVVREVEEQVVAADSLAADSLVADTVAVVPAVPEEVFALPGEVFGEESQLWAMKTVPRDGNGGRLSEGIVYQVSVLALAVGYCLLIYYFRSSVVALVKMLRSRIYTEKLLDEANYTFSLFLNLVTGLGVLALSIAIVRGTDLFSPGGWAGGLPAWAQEAAVPVVAVALGLVWLYQFLVVGLSGWITLSMGFAERLIYLRRLVGALASVTLVPLLLLCTLGSAGAQYVIFWLLMLPLAAVLGFMAWKTYMLFREQNVSILHWFLYLCAVEIFPVSLIVSLVYKSI